MTEQKSTILHVDDDEANRYAVTRSLRKAGFEVTEAADGTDALRKAAAQPDLIILDVRLPDIDGFEVCRRIKADPATSNIPILHLSASLVSGEDKAQGLNCGADGYLIRPVEPVELVATVNALLRARRSEEKLRYSEARFRRLVEDIKDYAIFMIDLDGLVTSWNAGAERVLGYTEAEVLGKPVTMLFTPEDRAAGVPERELRTVRDQGRASNERWHVRKNGERFFVDGVTTTVRDETGKLLGCSKLMRDVTERRHAEEERERLLVAEQAARAEAERAGRMKDDFLATLSHELRTPLNAILGWATILGSKSPSPDDLHEGLETIRRNARAQTQIIEDLLDMSRIISGKVRLDVQRLDLSSVVRQAVDTVTPAAEAKGIRIQAALDPTATISGDPGRLQQVFWNVLTNAIKFTPKGGRVQVILERVNSHIDVGVTDSGEGIPAEFLPRVFDRFRQADASTTRRHGGLGLGLSIVRQLVELHGGTVRAASLGAGHGSTFTVSLPLTVVQAEPGTPVEHRHPESDTGTAPDITDALCARLRGVRVLVVDDEADARALLWRVLDDCGAIVTTAASAGEALDRLREARPDVLVSDIGMPDEDGFSLIRRVRALGPEQGGNIPAVALTAYARVQDRVMSITAGFHMHVAKPVEPAEFIATVASLACRVG